MMSNKLHIDNYNMNDTADLLLDTNILIQLFYPIMQNDYMKKYESLWNIIVHNKKNVLLPAIQISEFINCCIRFQFGLYKKECGNDNLDFKKNYRNTDDYREKMNAILDIITNDIIPFFTIVNDEFKSMNFDTLFIYEFSYDFNDAILVQIAEHYKANIVTHDVDFANYQSSITLISANSKLLKFS